MGLPGAEMACVSGRHLAYEFAAAGVGGQAEQHGVPVGHEAGERWEERLVGGRLGYVTYGVPLKSTGMSNGSASFWPPFSSEIMAPMCLSSGLKILNKQEPAISHKKTAL